MTTSLHRRVRSERGAAVVELAFVGSLLFLLIFGIIAYGVAMSERQNMTQAAAEGARAAAVAPRSQVKAVALTATDQAVGAFDRSCGAGSLTCTFAVAPCSAGPVTVDQTVPTGQSACITVTLEQATHDRWYGNLPLVSAFFPDTLDMQSVVELNK